VDASYGLYDIPQSQQLEKLRAYLSQPTLCPVPPSGRAAELALWMARDNSQPEIALDAACRAMLVQMAEDDEGVCSRVSLRRYGRWRRQIRYFRLRRHWCWPPILTG
jgi:hypothetical protein